MKLEKVDNFLYLGLLLTREGTVYEEIEARIVKEDRSVGSLNTF